jgi:hypothetical protein
MRNCVMDVDLLWMLVAATRNYLPMVAVWCEEQTPTWLFDMLVVRTPEDQPRFTSTHGNETNDSEV